MRIALLMIAALMTALGAAPSHAETTHPDKRVALVVGNAAYRYADKLANPVSDAQGMREALKKLGFDVIYGEDLDKGALRLAIRQFADRVEGADVAIVYFAGHGATFGGTPYVVPVDAKFSSLDAVSYELVEVETLIGDLRQAKGVRIAVLDACRDNGAERELKRQAAAARGGGEVTRGLGPMKNANGMIVAYATQYGATAADNVGAAPGGLSSLFSWMTSSAGHSPFTAALLSNIATPGLDVRDMFVKVGRDVLAATGGRQRPEISISMYDSYALASAASPAAAAAPPAGSAPSEAERTWRLIQNTTSLAVLDDFIRQFGDTPIYGAVARQRREELVKSQLAQSTAPLTADQERGLKPQDTFRECENCPVMVVVPAGSFTMGSPESEKDRGSDEGPQHVVTIARPFAVGKLHVTRDQYAAFVAEMRYEPGTTRRSCSWRSPERLTQEGTHPVVCVAWDDAKAYLDWMAKKTGKPYRLLTEAEFEYAARARTSPGTYPRFWFGDDEKELCRYGNAGGGVDGPCNGEYGRSTSPAGHYAPNAFGLYDMFGNAGQWTADCYHDGYNGAPADGSAWTTGGTCGGGRVVRGGSWQSSSYRRGELRAGMRKWESWANTDIGFRAARTLAP